ncbi:hypothetical protein Aperf_G00000066059 [Anoplocephala perfoliata]
MGLMMKRFLLLLRIQPDLETYDCFSLPLISRSETEKHFAPYFSHNDTPLAPVGEKQASEVGESLKNLQIDQIFSSDLKRSSNTAKAIQEAYTRESLSIIENRLMRERNFGLNNGKPRSEIHEFIDKAKSSSRGCQMWREVQGECGHQIFWRAVNFFFELCDFAASHSDITEPNFPTLCSIETTSEELPLPILLPLRQLPVPRVFKSNYVLHENCPSGSPIFVSGQQQSSVKPMGYKGHYVLVSHGQWIREFSYILYALAEQTYGFPTHGQMVAVLNNCQFNQFGIAIDYERLTARVSSMRAAVESALNDESEKKRAHYCAYDLAGLVDDLPITTVCYHTRVDAKTVKGAATSAPPAVVVSKGIKSKKSAVPPTTIVSAGSGVETLYFAREDDEYAGLPEVK